MTIGRCPAAIQRLYYEDVVGAPEGLKSVLGLRRRQRGAVSVEFVFILPILLLLIFGIIQYAYYFFQVQQGAFAAREAARQAAVGTLDCDELVSLVTDRVGIPNPVYVSVIPDENPLEVGDNVRVLVEFQAADFGFPFIPYPNNSAVVEDAETRVENTDDTITGTYQTCLTQTVP